MTIRHAAKMVFSFAYFERLLGMPDDMKIYGVNMSPDDLAKKQFEIYVEHPGLPRVREGEELMRIPLSIGGKG